MTHRHFTPSVLSVAFVWAATAGNSSAADSAQHWPAWRGPLLTGVAPDANPPVTWSETSNVKWKIQIPGSGTSTPVIWGDQIFILTAIPSGAKPDAAAAPAPAATQPPPAASAPAPAGAPPAEQGAGQRRRGGGGGGGGFGRSEQPKDEHKFTIISYDRATGKERWQQTPKSLVPHEGHHRDHGYASASPVTDGEVLIVSFGSRGIFGYDLKGKLLWSKDLGQMKTRNSFGEGSSPALSGNTVVINWDHEGDDFVVALDKRSGKELWRQPRQENTTWTTPLVVEHGGKKQVVVSGSNSVRSYDLESGTQVWQAPGLTGNVIPAPVPGHGRVYAMSGFRDAKLQAIELGHTGDLAGSKAIAWRHDKNTPYVSSPLLYGDWLYFFSENNAQLSILDARNGEAKVDAARLEGVFGIYASPVGAANRVYLTGRDGNCWVIKNGPALEILAKNKLNDNFDASPAIVGKEIFLRGRKNFYALSEEAKTAAR